MYVALGTSYNRSTSSPLDATRYRSITTSSSFQTRFWNPVVRAAVTFAGARSFAMAPTVVTEGFQFTDVPLSASVIIFQSAPPHCGPGAAAPAWANTPAARAAAMATTTIFIFLPPVGSDAPHGRIIRAGSDGRSALARQLDPEHAQQHEEADAGEPERDDEARTPALAQVLRDHLRPEDRQADQRREADHDDR